MNRPESRVLFTRRELGSIREKALHAATSRDYDILWTRLLEDLAMAADMLDAKLARARAGSIGVTVSDGDFPLDDGDVVYAGD